MYLLKCVVIEQNALKSKKKKLVVNIGKPVS